MEIPETWSIELTHFGRKSGKPYTLRVWFVEIDGALWVGSLDDERNWVKNLRATGRARIDLGAGPQEVGAREGSPEELQRFERAILAKHPVAGRLLRLLTRGKRSCCFRLTPAQ